MPDQAYVFEPAPVQSIQATPDAGFMHLDAQIETAGVGGRHREQRIAVADADLELAGGKTGGQLDHPGSVVDAVLAPVILQRIFLRRRHPSTTADETPDRSFSRLIGGHNVTRFSSRRLLISAVFSARYRLSVLFYILSSFSGLFFSMD